MLAPLLALTVLATSEAQAAPATPAAAPAPACAAAPSWTPAPAIAPAAVQRRVGSVWVRSGPDGSLIVTPDPSFIYTYEAGPDEPSQPSRWFEYVLPAGSRREYSARTETLITVPRGVRLELENLMGDITVDAWDKDAVRVVASHDRRDRMNARVIIMRRQVEALRRQLEAERRGEAVSDREHAEHERDAAREAARESEDAERNVVSARLEDRVLQIETTTRMGLPAVVDYTITVPRWMPLRLSGMETDISVDGVRASIDAESIRGDVSVRGGRGPLQLSSVEGAVSASGCEGDLRLSSINNDVQLDDVDGALVLESVNGDIHIGRVKSRSVEASSVNGTVVYGGSFQPRGRYRLASHAGNLVVGVPVGSGVDVSVATFQGGFRTAFPVQMGPYRKGQKFTFVLGGGGSSLELESFMGQIELLRPEEVPAAAAAPQAPSVQRVPRAPTRIVKVYKAPTPPPAPPAPEQKEEN